MTVGVGGRVTVRLGDVDPTGRLRLDAIARYLQDVAREDAGLDADNGDGPRTWVMRRVALRINEWPRLGEELPTKTWCSGTGQRWAERSTTLGDAIESASLWVYVDTETLLPARLPERFLERWGATAGGRKVSGRRTHPDPPGDGSVAWREWPVRATDFDVLDHVNNAAYWHPVEQLLFDGGAPLPTEAEIEYRVPITRGMRVQVGVAGGGVWLRSGDTVLASVVLR